jgi:hypothetical protein
MELSPTEAQKVVERIVKEYGWLSDREREVTPPSALSAITNLRTALGATTRTYVTNLRSWVCALQGILANFSHSKFFTHFYPYYSSQNTLYTST